MHARSIITSCPGLAQRAPRGDLSPFAAPKQHSARETRRETWFEVIARLHRGGQPFRSLGTLAEGRTHQSAVTRLRPRPHSSSKSARSHAASHQWPSQKESARYAPEKKECPLSTACFSL